MSFLSPACIYWEKLLKEKDVNVGLALKFCIFISVPDYTQMHKTDTPGNCFTWKTEMHRFQYFIKIAYSTIGNQ